MPSRRVCPHMRLDLLGVTVVSSAQMRLARRGFPALDAGRRNVIFWPLHSPGLWYAMRATVRIAALAGLAASVPHPGFAWGPKAIAVIAQIAQDRLSQDTQAKLRELLLPGQNLADAVANITEKLILSDSSTGWQYSPSAAVGPVLCLVDTLPARCLSRLARTELIGLRTASQSMETQSRALRHLARYVIGLHDPFQCLASQDECRTSFSLLFSGLDRTVGSMTISAAWDRIGEGLSSGGTRASAKELAREITPELDSRWTDPPSRLEDWASGSHGVAADQIRAVLSRPSPPTQELAAFPPSYKAEEIPVVKEQMKKAAVRLAFVIDAAFFYPTPSDLGQASATEWRR